MHKPPVAISPALPAPWHHGKLSFLQRERRRVLLAAIEQRDQVLASLALAELGALMGAW